MTTRSELQQHIDAIDAARNRKGGKPDLSPHACDQVNRILRYAFAHWDEMEPAIYAWLYPERV